jgi:hypothetical protein
VVHEGHGIVQIFLPLLPHTAAAMVVTIHQPLFRYIQLCSALASAMPYSHAFAIRHIRRFQCSKSAKHLASQIRCICLPDISVQAAAAFPFVIVKRMGCYDALVSAIALAQPAGPARFPLFLQAKYRQSSVAFSGQVIGNWPQRQLADFSAATMGDGSSCQPLRVYHDLSSAITTAAPSPIAVFLFAGLFQNSQFPESFPSEV